MTINERIKAIRKKTGLSQTDFAERLGTTRGVITNLEGAKQNRMSHFYGLFAKSLMSTKHGFAPERVK